MAEDAVIIEIAAQAGYEAMRDIATVGTEWGEGSGIPWSWEDRTPRLREQWRICARKMLIAIEKIAP